MQSHQNTHTNDVILVAGATGQQGGAVIQHLLAQGWSVRALVRDVITPAAQALQQAGAHLVQADLDDPNSLVQAMQGVYGVFSVVPALTPGGNAEEERRGKNLADAAQQAGIQHFVYSSVGSANRAGESLGAKGAIEQHVRALGLPATILRPVFFMENFLTWAHPQPSDGAFVLALALHPETPLQLIAVDDIGAITALVFSRPQEFLGRSIEIAGDELTMPKLAAQWSETLGQPVTFVELPIEQVRSYSEAFGAMFEWFNTQGYDVDLQAVRALRPEMLTFQAWLRQVPATRLNAPVPAP